MRELGRFQELEKTNLFVIPNMIGGKPKEGGFSSNLFEERH